MLNYIWGFMVIVGIIYGSMTGNIVEVSNSILDSAKEAISLCITMLGVMAMWTGIMEIGAESGLIEVLSRKIMPVIKRLFPEIPEKNKAWDYISLNLIANFLGLGWAATPAGLKAMEELQKLNVSNCKERYGSNWEKMSEGASNAMCTFIIMNISSIQLVPLSMIAYRSEYGSVNPNAVAMPAILATFSSMISGIIYCMIRNRKQFY